MDLHHDLIETSWGWVGVVGSSEGIRYASLPEPTPIAALEHLSDLMDEPLPERAEGAFESFRAQLDAYFRGELDEWDVRLDLGGASAFFRRAWEACRSIPPGETRSYRWLAEQAGNAKAARGAGQAMARNRVPLVVPCHRVIGSDGALHGFGGGGLPLKARLLELEAGARRGSMPVGP